MHIDPLSPCPYPAGSVRKQVWLRRRALARLPLFLSGDSKDIEDERPDENNSVHLHHAQRRREIALSLALRGHRQFEIARLLGVTRQRVQQILAGAGVSASDGVRVFRCARNL